MMIKTVGRFEIGVGDAPQYWINLHIDGAMDLVSMTEEEARDLKYALESALRHIRERRK